MAKQRKPKSGAGKSLVSLVTAELPLPRVRDDALTVRQIREQTGFGDNKVRERLALLQAQGVLRTARKMERRIDWTPDKPLMKDVPVYWVEEKRGIAVE